MPHDTVASHRVPLSRAPTLLPRRYHLDPEIHAHEVEEQAR